MTKISYQILSLFLLLLLIICSCNSGEKGDKNESNPELEKTVLIFEDSITFKFFKQRKAVFKYLDDSHLPKEIEMNSEMSMNDFIINTNRNHIDLVYRDNSQLEFTYLLQKGDSILIQVKEKEPWLTSINKLVPTYHYNLELVRNTELFGNSYSKVQDFYFLWNEAKAYPFELDMNSDLIENKAKAMHGLQRELDWIDSLENAQLITEEIKAFYAAKNRLEQKKLEAYGIDSMEINTQFAVKSILKADNSELASSVFLDEFSELIITNQTQVESNALIDSLITQGQLNSTEKTFLFHHLKKEIPYLSFKATDKMLERYGDKLDNPAQVDNLSSKYKELLAVEPTIELMGLQNSFINFEELLDQKKGNFLYIDLWAAWCIPCIKSFPAALALNEEYKDNGLEVIFLSIDDNYKFWEEVARKYNIALPTQSFVAIKKEDSGYLKTLNVALIPRYLVFDQEGNLIHPNAPKPDSEEIKVFFKDLIAS